ncbi:FprA family A-type flavoprotein, partial [Candidatus Woesearchaeota archaeon]
NNLEEARVERVDYIVANHAEQDHSGSIRAVLERYPEAVIVANAKCKEFLQDMYGFEDGKFRVIADGETLSLGDMTLRFVFAPWVHWPETMLTFLEEDRILFTCDLFGSHLATSKLYAEDEHDVFMAAKRYYAEIMMPFRKNIQAHMKKISELNPAMIAPSHGPVYNRPEFILKHYGEWVSDKTENSALIAYVSMHDTTRQMAFFLGNELIKRGVEVHLFNLEHPDIGELAMASVNARTIVIASPTVLTGAHPNASYAALLLNELRPKARFLAVIGSYGWGGTMAQQIKSAMSHLKAEWVGEVLAKSHNHAEMFAPLEELADNIRERHSTD